jgi:phenylacetate-coenzyme A ligase PaaK-like adenylate-forming protein
MAYLDDDALARSSITLDVMAAMRDGAAGIASRQAERAAALLDAAADRSAFWRRRLKGRRIAAGALLPAIAPVHKAELMRHFDEWVADPALARDALRAFTADASRIGEPFEGRWWVWESSGSSGEPGVFVQDAHAMAVYDALEAVRRHSPRPWLRLMDPLFLTERFAFVGALEGHFASVVSVQRLRRSNPLLAGAWQTFSILQPVEALRAQLEAFDPTIVATYPTAAGLLADEAARGRLSIRPREVWTGGETLGAALRRRIERTFGCALRNSYGASEFLPIAWECGHGRLHVNADWVLLEPVDERMRPVPPGRLSHTTLLTNLANHVQPLIRVDLGDQVLVRPDPCPCGCALPTIDVQGRRDDVLVLPGSDGRARTLLPLALTTVIEDDAGVFDFQLQQSDAHTLLLRLGPGVREGGAEAARHALHDFAQRHHLAPVRVRVKHEASLPAGRSGKVRRVVAMKAVAAAR